MTDRVIIHENVAPCLPGTCILCGSAGGDHRKFIDFGKKIIKHGRVYFCDFCFADVNNHLGWMSPANSSNLAEQVIAMDGLVTALKEENAKLRNLASVSIDQLRSDLASFDSQPQTNSSEPKRGPGRPKKPQSGTAESATV